MSAQGHLNGQQLAMFMTPHELARLPLADAHEGESADAAIRRKYADSSLRAHGKWSSLKDDIVKRGVEVPVAVFHGDDNDEFWDGHHRLAVALHHRPSQLLPVEHYDMEHPY